MNQVTENRVRSIILISAVTISFGLYQFGFDNAASTVSVVAVAALCIIDVFVDRKKENTEQT